MPLPFHNNNAISEKERRIKSLVVGGAVINFFVVRLVIPFVCSPYWYRDFPLSETYSRSFTKFDLTLWMDFFAYTLRKRFVEYDWSSNVTFFNNPSVNLPEDLYKCIIVAVIVGILHVILRRYLFRVSRL